MDVGILALLALAPIVIIFLLLVVFKVPTEWACVIGWVAISAFALLFFNTSIEVVLRSSLAGVVSSLGITLLIAAAVLQIAFMEETGAVARIVAFIKSLSPEDEYARTMVVANGAGTTLVSIGATPAAVLPPIFKGLGYSDVVSVVLSVIGWIGLDAYGMLAICMVAVCGMTGMDIVELNKIVVLFLPIISTLCAFVMLYLMDKWKAIKAGWIPALIAGLSGSAVCFAIAYVPALQGAILLSGVIAGIVVMLCELAYVKIRGYKLFDESNLNDDDKASVKSMSLAKALSPWIIMVICLCVVNLIDPVNKFLTTGALACAVEIIPGSTIAIKPIWNAYFWAFAATLLSMIVIKPSKVQISGTLKKFGQRAPKPIIAVCVFYALGYVMNNTGMDPAAGWKVVDATNNMISCMAMASVDLFGNLFPLIAAPLTVIGAFVTSSQTSACIMFANYFIEGGGLLGVNYLAMMAIAVIAGGVASVLSPAKLLNAAALIGADGADREALAKVLVPTLLVIVVCMVMCFIACQMLPFVPAPVSG